MPLSRKYRNRRPPSKKALKPVPVFKSLEEEARFWDTHDTTEYDLEDSAEPLEVGGALLARVEKRRAERLAALLRLEPKRLRATQRLARRKGVTSEVLIKVWIDEGLRRESAMMTAFDVAFHDHWENLLKALGETESDHVKRCKALARSIEWDAASAGSEFSQMLAVDGIKVFEEVLRQIKEALRNENAPELNDPARLVEQIMHVHDLGKYIVENGEFKYRGADHEKRSAVIVLEEAGALEWRPINVVLLHDLALHHGLLGITRTGEASPACLWPILESLEPLSTRRKRLFLDLLIVLTCCDAGATMDAETKKYYLDDSRVELYKETADDLLEASTHGDAFAALFQKASDFDYNVARIGRIVTSGSRNLYASDQTIREALASVVELGLLDLKRFARTRFDHGFYVFEPLLWELNEEKAGEVSRGNLTKLLSLIGLLASGDEGLSALRKDEQVSMGSTKDWLSLIGLRDSFSLRDDEHKKRNGKRYELLRKAVRTGDSGEIRKAVLRAINKT